MAAAQKIKTLVIDNFAGEITPDLIGSLNSGLCPISLNTSGKAPTGNPYQTKGLQFLEGFQSFGGNTFVDPVLHTFKYGAIASPSSVAPAPVIYGVGMEGHFYQILAANPSTPAPDADSVVKFANTIGDVLHWGGGIFYDAGQNIVVVGTDSGVYWSSSSALSNPSSATWTAVTGSGFTGSMPRPMCQFLGTLYVGDSNKLVSLSSNYSAIVSSNVLSPGLPAGYTIRNLEVSADGTYLVITATQQVAIADFEIDLGQQAVYSARDSIVLYWNGTDNGYTSLQFFKGMNIVSLKSSASQTVMFAKDSRGFGIFDTSGNRLASIDDLNTINGINFTPYPPLLFSVDVMGKMFYFQFQMGTSLDIYQFDSETNKLYSLAQSTIPSNGSVVGGCCIASVHALGVISGSWQEVTRFKLYFFFKNLTGPAYSAFYLHLQNYGGTIGGAYTTQYQEFGRKIRPVQLRIYTVPTVTGNSFAVRLFDLALNSLINKTYTFAAGTDSTKAQGAMTKIGFSVACKPVSSVAFSIVPIASTPFFVEKAEIDYIDIENPPA